MTFEGKQSGPIAWMAHNAVAANLLMLSLLLGGALMMTRVKQEIFPAFELEIVNVVVPYPGASPAEVEQGIILAVEEAVRDVDDIKRVTAQASEGAGSVSIELIRGTPTDRALADIKAAVDRIRSFPEDAERPLVSLAAVRRDVISVVIYGEQGERVMRALADRVRDELLLNDHITSIDTAGVRNFEVSVEVPQSQLRSHNVGLSEIAQSIRRASVELPGGAVKTPKGEILLRTSERREAGREFENIVLMSGKDGMQLRLSDIATVRDGFEDTDESSTFNGKPAVMLTVYRVGEQRPLEIAETVKRYVTDNQSSLPPTVTMATLYDQSESYRSRMGLLGRNGIFGLLLVLFVLGLFLEIRLAFWVTAGMLVSMVGGFLLMPIVGASLNMISLMAFIITLGLVVDDAIVVGENIFDRRTKGEEPMTAAIRGAQEIAVPVVFSVLTTIVAFSPMLFITGTMGKFMWVIPIVVIGVLSISLVESLFVLPAHLAHLPRDATAPGLAFLQTQQRKVNRHLERFIQGFFRRVVEAAVNHRYLTVSIGVGILAITFALIAGGRINFVFLPRIEADSITVNAVLPFGAPVTETTKVKDRLVEAAIEVAEELGGLDKVTRGVFAQVGSSLSRRGPSRGGSGGAHRAGVSVFLVPSDQRGFATRDFAAKWREKVGEIAGVKSLGFTFSRGPSSGAAIDVELSHTDPRILDEAAARTASLLASFEGVKDIDAGYDEGKPQIDFRLKPAARTLGITELALGRQVRSAFYGAEALRQQRGRDEVRVMVRLPENERTSEGDLEALVVRSPTGGEIILGEAAEISRGRSYTGIKRVDGRRVVNVTADVDEKSANAEKILERFKSEVLPEVTSDFRGLAFSFEGGHRHRQEGLESLKNGSIVALIVIFILIAIPFRSYVQPLIVMSAIPFGIVGAVFGHLAMGFNLSLISLMGIVALGGVTVNDSLVLIVAINRFRTEGQSPFDSVVQGALRRFRPIILTSLTTFLGLAPMIFEPDYQARFLVPMALSLGYGILFATLVILLLVPAQYMIIEDIKRLLGVSTVVRPPQPSANQ